MWLREIQPRNAARYTRSFPICSTRPDSRCPTAEPEGAAISPQPPRPAHLSSQKVHAECSGSPGASAPSSSPPGGRGGSGPGALSSMSRPPARSTAPGGWGGTGEGAGWGPGMAESNPRLLRTASPEPNRMAVGTLREPAAPALPWHSFPDLKGLIRFFSSSLPPV